MRHGMQRAVVIACAVCCVLASQTLCAAEQTAATTANDAATRAQAWRWKSMTFASRVEDPAVRGHVYLQMAYVLGRAGELDDGRKAAGQIENPQTRVYAYSFVAKQHLRRGDKEAALRVMQECERSFGRATEKDRQQGYEYLVGKYADLGFVFEANAVDSKIKRTLGGGLERERIASSAAEHLSVAEGLGMISGGTWERLSVATGIVERGAKGEDLALALTAAREVTPAKNLDQSVARLVRALVKKKRLTEAREFAARITDGRQHATARGIIAAAEAEYEEIDQIQLRIAAAALLEEKLPLYKLLVKKQIKADQLGDAEATVEALVNLIEATERPDERSKFGVLTDKARSAAARSLNAAIAVAYYKAGRHADYERQMRLAAAAAADMENQSGIAKTMVLWQVLAVQLSADDIDGARETIERVKAAGEQPGGGELSDFMVSSLASKVAERLIARGDVTEGLKVAAEIRGSGVGGAISDVARALIRAGRLDDAKAEMRRMIAEGDAALAEMAEKDADRDMRYRREAVDDDRIRACLEVGAAMTGQGQDAELEVWLAEMPNDAMRAAACLGAAAPRFD